MLIHCLPINLWAINCEVIRSRENWIWVTYCEFWQLLYFADFTPIIILLVLDRNFTQGYSLACIFCCACHLGCVKSNRELCSKKIFYMDISWYSDILLITIQWFQYPWSNSLDVSNVWVYNTKYVFSSVPICRTAGQQDERSILHLGHESYQNASY